MLKGKTAIVTGGTKGIGFAIAKELASNNATVVICSRTKSELSQAVKELSKIKKSYGVICDVSQFNDCKKLIRFAVSKTKRIDILINNAGIYGPAGLLETNDPEDWQRVLAVNVLGTVYCTKLVLPFMKKRKSGKIINLAGAGVGGTRSLPRFSGYYISKAAIAALTENLGAELEPFSIQVNAIAPGGVASDLNMNLLKLDRSVLGKDMHSMLMELRKTGGTPPDLAAKLVAFLCFAKANHITGRLLSAKWDSLEKLGRKRSFTNNSFRLRRIDNNMFLEKK